MIPELNEERRKELSKQVKKMVEEGKVAIRAIRRDANDQIKKICIVCDEILETAILNAVCESLDPQIGLPRGELIVRSIVENEMWMLSAAFEYAGTVQPFNAAVKVTISAEDLPENFKLMQVVVTEATETTERTEEWIEVDFTCTEETMSFVTDAAALYVLVPVE